MLKRERRLLGKHAEFWTACKGHRHTCCGPALCLQARLTRVEQQLRSEEARRKRETFKQQVKVRLLSGVSGCRVGGPQVGMNWAPRADLPVHTLSVAARQAKERTAVEGGKRPFYLKKSEQRRLELLAKYEELQVGKGVQGGAWWRSGVWWWVSGSLGGWWACVDAHPLVGSTHAWRSPCRPPPKLLLVLFPPHPTPSSSQASGKLDKFLEKRRKKNAAKDHRYLPSTRRQAGGED